MMTLLIRRNEDGTLPKPAELGLKDYWHDREGRVDRPEFVEHDYVDSPDPSIVLDLEPVGEWMPEQEPDREARMERARRENHRRAQNAWYEAWLENWN